MTDEQIQKLREEYFNAHPNCEKCLQEGIKTAGVIVHQTTHIHIDSLTDDSAFKDGISLQTLCRKHHAELYPEMYPKRVEGRYMIDENGNVHPRY